MAIGRPRAFDTDKALDAAMDVFWRKSYQGASIADLTQAMEINSPSLYAAFGSKEGLFRAVLARYDELGKGFLTRVLEAETGREAVEYFLYGSADNATDPDSPPGCLLVQSGLSCPEDAAAIPTVLAKHRQTAELTLRDRLQCAKEQGELAPEVDTATMARYAVAIANGMCVQAAAGATRAELHKIADMAMRFWPEKSHRRRTADRRPKQARPATAKSSLPPDTRKQSSQA